MRPLIVHAFSKSLIETRDASYTSNTRHAWSLRTPWNSRWPKFEPAVSSFLICGSWRWQRLSTCFTVKFSSGSMRCFRSNVRRTKELGVQRPAGK